MISCRFQSSLLESNNTISNIKKLAILLNYQLQSHCKTKCLQLDRMSSIASFSVMTSSVVGTPRRQSTKN